MSWRLRKPALVVAMSVVMVGVLAAPVSAAPDAKNHQVRGIATADTSRCPGALDLAPQDDGWGLDGCLHLLTVDESRLSSGGVYKEYGTEQFVGDIVYSEGGVPDESTREAGTFDTEFVITSKWAGEPFASDQFHGRCQHPITSGTGAFTGATGRVDLQDTIVDGIAVEFPFFGHVRLANS